MAAYARGVQSKIRLYNSCLPSRSRAVRNVSKDIVRQCVLHVHEPELLDILVRWTLAFSKTLKVRGCKTLGVKTLGAIWLSIACFGTYTLDEAHGRPSHYFLLCGHHIDCRRCTCVGGGR